MPFTTRPKEYKIEEDAQDIVTFLKRIVRVIDEAKPYGMYIVLFSNDDQAHGYQFNLREEDYEHVSEIAKEHGLLYI